MKKNLLIVTLLFWLGSFSQKINVDTSTYSVPELVTEVLVNKSCVSVSNIKWRTGTDFGSTNGIGYFDNTNPVFPLTSGVILSTGNVTNAPGPNTVLLNDGNAAWTGDTDLEDTLLAAGITMNSTNATVLEFDFVPFSPNFNFQFLFASEEYGNFQCQFSDAFAFLLTNTVTGVTTNLAVVPNTTIPISVITIRDFLYNSSCPSENPSYFGTFNGGSAASGSATNFNGQTVIMNAASTTLTPNITYHIKLVIADRQDNQADSAIFLGANSFNVGQDVLGSDLTTANNTAVCNNEDQIIRSGLNPSIYSFKWTFNGSPIGGNTPDITVNQPGVYGLTYTIISTGCEVTTDYITVEYNNALTTPDPVNLYKCNSGQPSFTYDLSFNTPIVNVPGTQISYHSSLADANANNDPLPNNYTITSGSLPATIWIRILELATGCAVTKSFQLEITPPPIANKPSDITLCETTLGIGTANFNISSQSAFVLGGQSPTIYSVSYYRSIDDAISGTNPINPSNVLTSGNALIVVKVQNTTDPTCYNTTSFNLIVEPKPNLDIIPDQHVCIGFTLPPLVNPGNYYSGPNKGLPMLNPGDIISTDQVIYIYNEIVGTVSCSYETSFNVKIVTPVDITPSNIIACDQYVLPTLSYGTRYFTLPGGPTGGGTELFGGTSVTTSGIVYTYFISTDIIPCEIQSEFNITINNTPVITNNFSDVFDCISYNLPPLTVGNYYTYNAATGGYALAISPITTTTTLYVFDTKNDCRSQDIIFTVYISNFNLTDVTQCQPYNLPPAPVGEYRDAPNGGGNLILPGLINNTTKIYTYVPGASCTTDSFTITINAPFLTTPQNVRACESFTLPAQVDGVIYYSGPNQGLPILSVGDVITNTTTVYIYKASLTVLGCFNEKPWLITIDQRPLIDSRGNVEQCNSYVLSPLTNGNYFDDPNGINPLAAGTVISTDNRIYIYAVNPNDPTCFSENSFDISIKSVEADPIPALLTYCNSFTFPPLPTSNNFYYDAPGGPYGGGNIIPFGTTVTPSTVLATYYIYHETGDRLKCSDEIPFSITFVPKPTAYPVTPIETCDTFGANDGIFEFDLTSLSIRNQVLNGQIPDANFTLTFYNSLADANTINAIPISNPSTYQNDNAYTDSVWIRVTNNTSPNACFDVVELKLIINQLPVIQLLPEYFFCEDYETGTLLNPATLNTGIITSNYIFEWTLDGNPFGGNTSSITTTQVGNYVVRVTNTNTNCINTMTTKVIKYAPYLEIIYSDAFENSTFITANVLGVGTGFYEYQIDDSAFQDSNIFTNIAAGEHKITVRDKNGNCNPAPLNAVIINYPKYFTPNGDGYHETWNITHLASTNPNAPINIFDRYGKFIKEIFPASEGWNGTFNGQQLPSSDYWFTVDYNEKGSSKVFKSHFSLKR